MNRRSPLVQTGAVGKEEFNHATAQLAAAKSSVAAAQSAVLAAREQLTSNQTLTDGNAVEQHPNVLRAAARVREAYLALKRADLLAPVDGYVAKRSVQLGQRVAAGAPLMSVIALDQVWVDANFKESQLQEPAHRPAGRAAGRRVRQEGRVPRHDRRAGRGHRRGVRAAAGAERDRQLDQGRAARAGAHRARCEGARRAPAARRPVDGREGRHQQHRRPDAGRRLARVGHQRRPRCSTRSTARPTATCAASSPPTAGPRLPRARRTRARPSSATPGERGAVVARAPSVAATAVGTPAVSKLAAGNVRAAHSRLLKSLPEANRHVFHFCRVAGRRAVPASAPPAPAAVPDTPRPGRASLSAADAAASSCSARSRCRSRPS